MGNAHLYGKDMIDRKPWTANHVSRDDRVVY